MSGDDMIFDPTKSKKKKKKAFMLDEEGDTQTEETQPSETKEVEPEPTEDKDLEADEEDNRKKYASDDLDDLNFFNQKKKKKKTEKIFDIDEAEGVKDLQIESSVQESAEPEDDLDIMFGNKKKKKKVKFPDKDEILEKGETLEDEDSKKDDGPAWAGSKRDYTYEEEKNLDMVAREKRKSVMKPPQVKTYFVNLTDIYGNNQLVIKKDSNRNRENVLRSYNKEYVTCHTCQSPDAILQKDRRFYFPQRETCHSRCSVASIKTGFQALCAKAN
uniref:Eukaryotic translation initiation factor 2 subunit 2 n=1 Tax=Rhinopithecus bieti TaxID=61621 RepID=A0A2K6MJ02_RHIBE